MTVIVAALMTLVTLVTLSAWIDSYAAKESSPGWARVWVLRRDVAEWMPSFTVSTGRGTLGLQHNCGHAPARGLPSKDFSFLGLQRSTFLRNWGFINYYVPFWMLFVLFSAHPTVTFTRASLRRRRLRRRGTCFNCNYNLTGLPEPRCPECGQPFEPKDATQ
ncbi:MAG: hypothetical protein IID33_15335 [Planctomycetes bacterium]|nr:hypothetical protein [Planctomycetota bacterium]